MNLLVERLGEGFVPKLTPLHVPTDHPGSLDQAYQQSSSSATQRPQLTSTAPLLVIRDVATEFGIDANGKTGQPLSDSFQSNDIIGNGLISAQDASSLLQLSVILDLHIFVLIVTRFHEHYGRWVYFNSNPTSDSLLAEVRKSPLLLCACCLIAIRHTSEEVASRLAPQLFKEASSLLSAALLVVPQSTSFFQAALILSQWSTTIGQVPLSIDSWLLSGFALQHCHSTDLFSPVLHKTKPSSMTRLELNRWCIWNHLCLVHLQYRRFLPIIYLS